MKKEIRISISLETGTSTKILILEDGIKIDGKSASFSDCIFWSGIFKEMQNLFMIQGHKVLKRYHYKHK